LDSPIKQAIQRNFTPAQVEIIEVSIKAIIATVTTIGAAIVLASVLFLNPLARPEFILIPLRLWALLLTALGIRKKPVPWGTVYDAITKQPVDPVRVSLVDIEGKVVETSITDSAGRYGFAAAPGIYKVVLSKTNYLFPSHVIAQQNNMRDELYEKPYFGDYLPYDAAAPIEKNIPIDPVDFDTAAFAKKNGDLSVHYSRREAIAEQLFTTLFFTTFAVVVASLLVYPQMYNVIIFFLYIAAFVMRRQNKRAKQMGRIYDLYGKPLAHVTMKVYSAVDNSLIKTTTTSRSGRYYLHLPQGLYYIRVERKTTDGLFVPVYSSPELMVRYGTLNKVFSIAYS
jgi:5-hydroxyisourate hydrolase-like protein (transthyretin family)